MALSSVSLAPRSELLAGWDDVIALGTCSNRTLFNARLSNWERAARHSQALTDGRVWTPEVLDALVDHFRDKVDWPLRPSVLVDPPEDFLMLPVTIEIQPAPFRWSWLDFPIPWIDETGTSIDVFPLPVACLEGDL